MTDTVYPPQDRLLRLPELKARTGLSRATVYEVIARGDFPAPIKVGRISAWPESEVRAWIEARKAARQIAEQSNEIGRPA
jgi:prophage regulatory protein